MKLHCIVKGGDKQHFCFITDGRDAVHFMGVRNNPEEWVRKHAKAFGGAPGVLYSKDEIDRATQEASRTLSAVAGQLEEVQAILKSGTDYEKLHLEGIVDDAQEIIRAYQGD